MGYKFEKIFNYFSKLLNEENRIQQFNFEKIIP